MDIREYELLDNVEDKHWFYRGKRRIIRYWIQRNIELHQGDNLIDIGCGTGRFLAEWKHSPSYGMDFSRESLRLVTQKVISNIVQGKLPALPFKRCSASIIVGLDVLEHCQDDAQSLIEMIEILKPGGIICITVPALPLLWSDWDISLHHFRRYTYRSLSSILPRNIYPLHLSYINEIGLFPIMIIRYLRKLPFSFFKKNRAEDKLLPELLNKYLEKIFVWLACRNKYRPLIGVSLLLIAKKIN